ncbi:MAG: hypothetical protein M4579_006780 [Chaenotheca gracillima]|nr:MAG: hypothetical protein M4579_006780 [Chaenotheca gracillima]
MSTATSKRQQVRNERALQDLIKTVPGNDRCADCQAKNPGDSSSSILKDDGLTDESIGWASWSLGIFLCMRCASLHRKLGTHLSKVKSLSMDSWSNDQVDNMKRMGNVVSNRLFTPNNSKPNLPLDVDEVDSAMERFIRQKYEHRLFQGGHIGRNIRHNTGTSTSSEEPPPLPPKPGSRFGLGLRAASSTFPLSSNSGPGFSGSNRSAGNTQPSRTNDQATMFGATFEANTFESKLATLAEMGFADERRNATALRGLDGNLERTIETLVRIGEGGPNVQRQVREGRPVDRSMPSSSQAVQSTLRPGQVAQGSSPSIQPDVARVAGANAATGNSYNPFLNNPSGQSQAQPQPQPQLDQAFQNLRVSQPLFPNATGGFPQALTHESSYYQTLTPPIPSSTQQHYFSSSQSQVHPFFQPQYLQTQQLGSSNPYLSQASPTSNPTNPFHGQTFPQQAQQQMRSDPQGLPSTNQVPQYSSYQQPQPQQIQQQPQQAQMLLPQQTSRADKSSIMALYNYPHLAPAPNSSTQSPSPSSPLSSYDADTTPALPSLPENASGPGPGTGLRSVSMPSVPTSAGSRNPFLTNGGSRGQDTSAGPGSGAPARGGGMSRHVSQESVDVGGWQQSGRHSPDAFASLSSRFVR